MLVCTAVMLVVMVGMVALANDHSDHVKYSFFIMTDTEPLMLLCFAYSLNTKVLTPFLS